MRKEMEALQRTTLEGASQSKASAVSPEKGDIEKMRKIRDEVSTLMQQIVSMASELQQGQQMPPKMFVDQQTVKHPQNTEQEATTGKDERDPTSKREVDYCSAPYDLKEAAAKIAELERVQYVLRTQLGRAAEDVMRMANERDLLMEISNSLHADFNRSLQQEKIKQSAPTTGHHHNLSPQICHKDSSLEQRRRVASTHPHRSRESPPRPTSVPQISSGRIGGQGHSPHKQVWINNHGSVRGYRKDSENSTDRDSRYVFLNEETEQEKEERRLLLEGRMTPLQERPEVQPDFVHKGTPSQRSKLQASVKRREVHMANRVKVRNYNIKDDPQ
ncbi:hypothetical protein MPTK1_6g17350 [Marchantia polymorpha subsp. ruderalis]|nr:hypothetical protein MARPO_0184s0015 [Marchantia polymorpha]BBN15135.1 hypothetical protein Mp_6g17350 [Marchantia polymorpha subsp. ruderalis]|eukprot:PTQ27777.1 hypothetical protein MARPO_0184s0015 [Marchantia polymorpha]